MRIKKKANYNTLITALIIVITLVVCFFSNNTIFIKEFSNRIYINNGENNIYIGDKIVLYDIVKPKSFSFSIPIFMYHFITDDYGTASDTQNYMPTSKLEQQLKYIAENGYETIYITELDKIYKYKKPVALTFDDCYIFFYNNAFPLLKKYNLKASIYIMTEYINGPIYFTTDQIKEMRDSGIIDIQSHTLTHPKLSRISIDQMKKEVIESKLTLKSLFNIDSNVFCYPYGDFNNNVVSIVKENYEYGLDMLGGVYHSNRHDKYKIPRIYANRSMPMSTYINYLKQSKVNAKW